eukprot:234520-Chlamydomonas_euryale.AAC.2
MWLEHVVRACGWRTQAERKDRQPACHAVRRPAARPSLANVVPAGCTGLLVAGAALPDATAPSQG